MATDSDARKFIDSLAPKTGDAAAFLDSIGYTPTVQPAAPPAPPEPTLLESTKRFATEDVPNIAVGVMPRLGAAYLRTAAGAKGLVGDIIGDEQLVEQARQEREDIAAGEKQIEADLPVVTKGGRFVRAAADSIALNAPLLLGAPLGVGARLLTTAGRAAGKEAAIAGVTGLTKNVLLPAMGTQVGLDVYGQKRDEGLSPLAAGGSALVSGAAETLFERVSTDSLMKVLTGGKENFLANLGKYFGKEIVTELPTTTVQSMSDILFDTRDPVENIANTMRYLANKPVKTAAGIEHQLLPELGETAVVTAIQTGMTGGAARTARLPGDVVSSRKREALISSAEQFTGQEIQRTKEVRGRAVELLDLMRDGGEFSPEAMMNFLTTGNLQPATEAADATQGGQQQVDIQGQREGAPDQVSENEAARLIAPEDQGAGAEAGAGDRVLEAAGEVGPPNARQALVDLLAQRTAPGMGVPTGAPALPEPAAGLPVTPEGLVAPAEISPMAAPVQVQQREGGAMIPVPGEPGQVEKSEVLTRARQRLVQESKRGGERAARLARDGVFVQSEAWIDQLQDATDVQLDQIIKRSEGVLANNRSKLQEKAAATGQLEAARALREARKEVYGDYGMPEGRFSTVGEQIDIGPLKATVAAAPKSSKAVVADAFAKAVGRKIVWFDAPGSGAQGYYSPANSDTIYINAAKVRDSHTFIATHELTHWLEFNAKEGYTTLLDMAKNAPPALQSLAKKAQAYVENQKQAMPNMDQATQDAELAANFIGLLMQNEQSLAKFAKVNPGTFQRIAQAALEVLDSLIAKIDPTMAGLRSGLKELQQTRERVNKIFQQSAKGQGVATGATGRASTVDMTLTLAQQAELEALGVPRELFPYISPALLAQAKQIHKAVDRKAFIVKGATDEKAKRDAEAEQARSEDRRRISEAARESGSVNESVYQEHPVFDRGPATGAAQQLGQDAEQLLDYVEAAIDEVARDDYWKAAEAAFLPVWRSHSRAELSVISRQLRDLGYDPKDAQSTIEALGTEHRKWMAEKAKFNRFSLVSDLGVDQTWEEYRQGQGKNNPRAAKTKADWEVNMSSLLAKSNVTSDPDELAEHAKGLGLLKEEPQGGAKKFFEMGDRASYASLPKYIEKTRGDAAAVLEMAQDPKQRQALINAVKPGFLGAINKLLPMETLVSVFGKNPVIGDALKKYYGHFLRSQTTRQGAVSEMLFELRAINPKNWDAFVNLASKASLYQMTMFDPDGRLKTAAEQWGWIGLEQKEAEKLTAKERIERAEEEWKRANFDTKLGAPGKPIKFIEAYKEVEQAANELAQKHPEALRAYRGASRLISLMHRRETTATKRMFEDLYGVTVLRSELQNETDPARKAKLEADLKEITTKMNQRMIESGITSGYLRGDYWPLSRFGKYVLLAKAKDPAAREREDGYVYEQFESLLDQHKALQELKATHGATHDIEAFTTEGSVNYSSMIPASFKQRVLDQIDAEVEAKATGLSEEELQVRREQAARLKEIVSQQWLMSRPEVAAVRRGQQRKSVLGYNEDALRAAMNYIVSAGNRVSYLEDGRRMEELLGSMSAAVKEFGKQSGEAGADTVLRNVVNDLGERARQAQVVDTTELHRLATKISSVWLMSSPSTALVQMTQPFVVALPRLAAGFGGMAKAFPALNAAAAKAMKTTDLEDYYTSDNPEYKAVRAAFGIATGEMDAARGKLLRSDQERVADALRWIKTEGAKSGDPAKLTQMFTTMLAIHRGILSITQFNEALDIKTGRTATGLSDKFLWFMKYGEEKSRLTTFYAAFDLAQKRARAAGKTEGQAYVEAFNTAEEITRNTMFDFSKESKGAVLQKALPRVLLQFQYFRINMMARYADLVMKATKDADPQVRAKAKAELAYFLGTASLAGGLVGGPAWVLVSFMNALAGAMADDDEPPVDVEAWTKEGVRRVLGDYFGNIANYGLPAALGAQTAQRVGVADIAMPFGGTPHWVEGDAAADWWVTNKVMGPFYSVFRDWVDGASDIAGGKPLDGTIKIMPKIAKDFFKTYKVQSEGGVRGADGQMLKKLEEFEWTPFDIALQVVGINPLEYAIPREQASVEKALTGEISKRRSRLLADWDRAIRSQNEEAIQSAVASIVSFNTKSPLFAIDRATLSSSAKTALREQWGLPTNLQMRARLQYGGEELPEGDEG